MFKGSERMRRLFEIIETTKCGNEHACRNLRVKRAIMQNSGCGMRIFSISTGNAIANKETI